MENYCAFSRNHKCVKWTDYEVTRHELEEADQLCHGNWIEIQRLSDYINELTCILKENGIGYPDI
ncbi:MAG TPA: mobility-associated LCxxNW protein [Ruminococcus sp.]|nr:mobility-associated LCxxNW protein [Ruminococcus sp.]